MTFIRNRWYIAAWDGEVANAPLSLGTREGDNLRYKYQGMLIGSDGSPEDMPSTNQPLNKKICTQSYNVMEKYRYIWIWIGDQISKLMEIENGDK